MNKQTQYDAFISYRHMEPDQTAAAKLQAMLESNPMHRLGRPEEIGEVIAFLASERASYVNGQWFLVNGGK